MNLAPELCRASCLPVSRSAPESYLTLHSAGDKTSLWPPVFAAEPTPARVIGRKR